MTLRELILTTDVGMGHFRVIGAFNCNHPTIDNFKNNQEMYKKTLDREVKEWYTSECPPKSGRWTLDVWLSDKKYM